MAMHDASLRSIPTTSWRLLTLVGLLAPMLASAGETDFFDAKVTKSSGQPTKLSKFWGKPTIVFYEHPDSLQVNQAAKQELKRLGEVYQLRDLVGTVAVIDLEELNWWPARGFALDAMQKQEKKVRIPVLADLTGELRKSPWRLNAKASTILVISPRGELLFRNTGPCEGEQFEELKATLRGLLNVTTQR
jgi:hypothetical protein